MAKIKFSTINKDNFYQNITLIYSFIIFHNLYLILDKLLEIKIKLHILNM